MSTRLLAVIAAVALLAVSCGLLKDSKDATLDPLVRAADGTLYAPKCLVALGVGRKAECAVETNSSGARSLRQQTGDASSWLSPYYDFFQSNGYLSYIDPYFYAPQAFCGRWGWSPSCFDWFGYGNWWSPSQGYCDQCFYGNAGSSSSSTATSPQGGSVCPSYCSSWWYPWPWQPTADACRGLSGTYTGTCWDSSTTAGLSQISLTVAASNNVCQVTTSGYATGTVTLRNGMGSAALSGNGVTPTAAFVDFYGSGTFVGAGYNVAANSWFRCSSNSWYQPWY